MEKGQKALDEVSVKISAKKKLNQEYGQAVTELNDNIKKLENEYKDMQQQFHIENSRLASLTNMAER